MKRVIASALLPFAVFLFSCNEDFESPKEKLATPSPLFVPTGSPASFSILENGIRHEINGDRKGYSMSPETRGSDVHRVHYGLYTYKLECVESFFGGVSFNFYLLANKGQPNDTLRVGTYQGYLSNFENYPLNDYLMHCEYSGYHDNIQQTKPQLGATVYITNKTKEGRIDGSFTGKYYQVYPETDKLNIVTIKGTFKNVYIYETW